jgi:hypothetical protein
MTTYNETDETRDLRQKYLNARTRLSELLAQRAIIDVDFANAKQQVSNDYIEEWRVDALYYGKLYELHDPIRIARSDLRIAIKNARTEYRERTEPSRHCDVN